MRDNFINELISLAKKNENIFLIVGDIGYSVVEPFANKFPNRFINAGVSEQNMTSLAAGMASEGCHVFTYSIANFPTFRCAEQIRNDIDYHRLSVTVVAVGGGLSYGSLGYSHHAVQDYSLIRSMPNMLIASPSDPKEVRSCLRYLISHPQPSYLRLGKAGEPIFHKNIPRISAGKWIKIKDGTQKKAILCTGNVLNYAIKLKEKSKKYCDYFIFTLPLWGMKYKHLQPKQISKFDEIVIFEDHLEDGGFGSWLLESTNGLTKSKLILINLDSKVCDFVASQKKLNQIGGLG